jgi:hypothetical protein
MFVFRHDFLTLVGDKNIEFDRDATLLSTPYKLDAVGGYLNM